MNKFNLALFALSSTLISGCKEEQGTSADIAQQVYALESRVIIITPEPGVRCYVIPAHHPAMSPAMSCISVPIETA